MQYRLYESSNNDVTQAVNTVLANRGIHDPDKYMHLDPSVLVPYGYLDNIDKAVDCFEFHYNKKNKIGVLFDEDVDGVCSGSMMFSYITDLDPDYPVQYILHKEHKAHGLTSDAVVPDDVKLLIIPDAGTNDVEQCKLLNRDIIVLDHHEVEENNPYAIIVNNQASSRYSNKELCGAGVVYKFLQALDDRLWNDGADKFLDLCALANISDLMNVCSYETKYLIELGLNQIENKCFRALIDCQQYSMKGIINIHTIQWYITPIINGMVRVGNLDEKELLIKAFIEKDETFDYQKKKTGEITQESIYERTARLCKNAKAKQDRLKEKGVKQILEIIRVNNDDKVIIVDTTSLLHHALSGLVAIKIAEIYNRPCILLNKIADEEIYRGSARNINNSPILSFKDVINSSNIFNWGKGHANAFGVNIDTDKKDNAMTSLNTILRDIEYDSTYLCDFILDVNQLTPSLIKSLIVFDNMVGQGLKEPLIAIENISLNRNEFDICGKKSDTVKFRINDIEYIQFGCTDSNSLFEWLNTCWCDEDIITFNVVGSVGINEFNNIKSFQFTIKDLVVISKTSVDEDNDDKW